MIVLAAWVFAPRLLARPVPHDEWWHNLCVYGSVITFTWDPVEDATGYSVYRLENPEWYMQVFPDGECFDGYTEPGYYEGSWSEYGVVVYTVTPWFGEEQGDPFYPPLAVGSPLPSLYITNPALPPQWLGDGTTPPWWFDDQIVASTAPNSYPLSISGLVWPEEFDYHWSITSPAGSLTNIATSTPSHTPPSSVTSATGVLTLQAYDGGSPTGVSDSRTIRVYDSHLGRDKANVGELNGRFWPYWTLANCGVAMNHAYNAAVNSSTNPPLGSPHRIFDKNNTSSDTLTKALSNLAAHAARGRVVKYGGIEPLDHVETLTGTTEATWGANTPASEGSGHWSDSSITAYYSRHGPDGTKDQKLTWIDIYY